MNRRLARENAQDSFPLTVGKAHQIRSQPFSKLGGTGSPLKQLFQSNDQGGYAVVCLRCNDTLIGYKVPAASSEEGTEWTELWRENVFSGEATFPEVGYPWTLGNVLEGPIPQIILRNKQGIQFYRVNSKPPVNLRHLATDTRFHDIGGWNRDNQVMAFGPIFHNTGLVGVVTRNANGLVQFYSVRENRVAAGQMYPVWELQKKLTLDPEWNTVNNSLVLYAPPAPVGHEEDLQQAVFVVRSSSGVSFYQFDPKYKMKRLLQSSQVPKPPTGGSSDTVFFAKLLNSARPQFPDILQLNSTGLFLFHLGNMGQEYACISVDTSFASGNGWLKGYTNSIRFADLDRDGDEELVFTGKDGLMVLSFEQTTATWTPALSFPAEQLSVRFSDFVGYLPPVRRTSGFGSLVVQDEHGILQQVPLKKSTTQREITTTTPPSTTTTTQSTTTRPQRTTTVQSVSLKSFSNSHLRWAEQWNGNRILNGAVDAQQGLLQLAIPFTGINFFPGWAYQLQLKYNSRNNQEEAMAGFGWWLDPVYQLESIVADFKQSVFLEDAEYYVIGRGQPLRLEPVPPCQSCPQQQQHSLPQLQFRFGGSVKETENVNVTYDLANQRWTIENSSERVVYGVVTESIQKTLSWPNWRGPGTTTQNLQQVSNAWYVYSRENKKTGARLRYEYEQDLVDLEGGTGKRYTGAIRLQKITDQGTSSSISFGYEQKGRAEYEVASPKYKDKYRFPTRLSQSHYLTWIRLQGTHVHQQFNFGYQVRTVDNKNVRLLSEIKQQFSQNLQESLFQFQYSVVNGQHLMTRANYLPTSFSTQVTYKTGRPPPTYEILGNKALLQIPVAEPPKIAYGGDYAVVVYKAAPSSRSASSLHLQVFNPDFTNKLADCEKTVEQPLQCPSISINSKIKHFSVQPFRDHFNVLISGEDDHVTLLSYSRDQNNSKWNSIPNTFSFPKDASMHITDTLIAYWSREENKFTINEKSIQNYTNVTWSSVWQVTGQNPRITGMYGYNKLLATYDDRSVNIYYRPSDTASGWVKKTIERADSSQTGGTSKDILRHTFDLPDETVNSLGDMMSKIRFQMYGNMIALSGLELTSNDRGGKDLAFVVRLLLVDGQYNASNRATFTLWKESIDQLEYRHTTEGTTYVMKYRRQGGRYKVVITRFYGQQLENIISEQKDNLKPNEADQLRAGTHKESQKLIDSLNDNENTKKFLKSSFLFRDKVFHAQMTPEGVVCGEDILLRNTGSGWQKTKLDRNSEERGVPLGQQYFLQSMNKEDDKQLAIYRQGQNEKPTGGVLRNLVLRDSGQMANMYPSYIAYEPSGTQKVLKVITFSEDKMDRGEHSLENEVLVAGASTPDNLVTIANFTGTSGSTFHSESYEMRVRPVQNTLLKTEPIIYVSDYTFRSDGGGDGRMAVERSTKIEREYKLDDAFSVGQNYTERVIVTPGGRESVSGHYEIAMQFSLLHNNTRSLNESTVTTTWYDAQGNLVETQLHDNDKRREIWKEDEEEKKKQVEREQESILMDATGSLQIADISPLKVADQMVVHYGFEEYESQKVVRGGDEQWVLHNAEVVQGGFSFTGNNYLHLRGNTAYLVGRVTPKEQKYGVYVASCWLRCAEGGDCDSWEVGKVVPYFRVIVKTSEGVEILPLLGRAMKHQLGWWYVEIPVNFENLREIYESFVEHNEGMEEDENVTFQLTLRVSTSPPNAPAVDIHLDHVRFQPFTLDLQANVYSDARSSAIIDWSGRVSRSLFSRRTQQKIGQINEDNVVIEVVTTTATGNFLLASVNNDRIKLGATLSLSPKEFGHHEVFDPVDMSARWSFPGRTANNAWQVARGQLIHVHSATHGIRLHKSFVDTNSYALRFDFKLEGVSSELEVHLTNTKSKLRFTRGQTDDSLKIFLASSKGPPRLINQLTGLSAEVILVQEKSQVWMWVDGVLLLEETLENPPTIKKSAADGHGEIGWSLKGHVVLDQVVLLSQPSVKVEYENGFGETVQTIQLENESSALVTEILYDSLGREAITTKAGRVRMVPRGNQSLLGYRPHFVRNRQVDQGGSVWQTGKMEGEISQLFPSCDGYPYTRTVYEQSPLGKKTGVGLPSELYSVQGPYSVKMSRDSGIHFIDNLFPQTHGKFRQEVEYTQNGSVHVTVFDKKSSKVAKYVRAPGYNHLLTTYEYNEASQLVKILPPMYHQVVNTEGQLQTWEESEQQLTTEGRQIQKEYGTFLEYDKTNGLLALKTTPDGGTVHYLYDYNDQLRFMVNTERESEEPLKVVYMDYDPSTFLLSESGHLGGTLPSMAVLKASVNLQERLPFSRIPHQQVNFSQGHRDPALRGRVKHFVTHQHDDMTVLDKIRFNAAEQVVSKSTLIADIAEDNFQLDMDYVLLPEAEGGQGMKVKTFKYPVKCNGQPLTLHQEYNKQGKLIQIRVGGQNQPFASFEYDPQGQMTRESFTRRDGQMEELFSRSYGYSHPGFLESIRDPFLEETLTYTSDGYGQDGFGDGMVMSQTFRAPWSESADPRWFQIDSVEESDVPPNTYLADCVKALKRIGYLSRDRGAPQKTYLPLGDGDVNVPSLCRGERGLKLAKMLAQKQQPREYGHRFAYGAHGELVKAKYFSSGEEAQMKPLQPTSFACNLPSGSGRNQWQSVWVSLAKRDFIITDTDRKELKSSMAKQGVPFLKEAALRQEISELNSDLLLYAFPIGRLILHLIGTKGVVGVEEFQAKFLEWTGMQDGETADLVKIQSRRDAVQVYNKLKERGYLPTSEKLFPPAALMPEFMQIFNNNEETIRKAVKLLVVHFDNELGTNPYDVQSYDIDGNGNHRSFNTGFDRWSLSYHNGTNKISEVTLGYPEEAPGVSGQGKVKRYSMEHDKEGNVIRAEHRNIKSITYHPVSQRTEKIEMMNGVEVRFYYDAHGERVLKRVYNAEGYLTTETSYLRDPQGRVMVDIKKTFSLVDETVTSTVSTAYLYGPRGLLGFIRNDKFYFVTTDHLGSIRLVIDGNSRRVVAAYDYLPYGAEMRSFGNDPDGQLIFRFAGQEWDEETGLYNFHARMYDPSLGRFYQVDPKAQYFSPYKYAGNSPVSLVDPDGEFAFMLTAIIVCAVAGAYLGGAAANKNWNPVQWDYKKGSTWLGIVGGGVAGALLPVGFAASASTIGSIAAAGALKMGVTLSASTALGIGVGATTTLGLGAAYLSGVAANNRTWDLSEWNWKEPGTYNALFQGFGTGSGIVGGVGSMHTFAKEGKALIGLAKLLNVNQATVGKVFLTVSYAAGGGLAYGSGVFAQGGKTNPLDWDWSDPSLHLALINGFDSGTGWPQNFMDLGRAVTRMSPKTWKGVTKALNPKSVFSKANLKSILKNPKHPMYKTAGGTVMAYFMGAQANGNWDFTKWNYTDLSTYESVINGAFFGKDFTRLLQQSKKGPKDVGSVDIVNLKQTDVGSNLQGIKKWSSKVKKSLDNLITRFSRAAYERLVMDVFNSKNTPDGPVSGLLAALPPAVRRNLQDFMSEGFGKWRDGESKAPADFQKLIKDAVDDSGQWKKSKDLDETWKTDDVTDDGPGGSKDILTDNDLDFMTCRGGGGARRRRGIACSGGGKKKEIADYLLTTEMDYTHQPNGKAVLVEPQPVHIDPITVSDPSTSGTSGSRKKHKADPPQPKTYLDKKRIADTGDESYQFTVEKPKSFAEHFALTLEEIPTMSSGNSRMLYNGVRGMLDGISLTSQSKGKKVYVADALDNNFKIGGEPAPMLHSYHLDGDTLKVKSFVVVEEFAMNKATQADPSGRAFDLDAQLANYMKSSDLQLKVPEAMAGSVKGVESSVYIIFKETNPATKRPPAAGATGTPPKKVKPGRQETTTVKLLVMSPEVNLRSVSSTHGLEFTQSAPKVDLSSFEQFVSGEVHKRLTPEETTAKIEQLTQKLGKEVVNRYGSDVLLDLDVKRADMEKFFKSVMDSFDKNGIPLQGAQKESGFQGYVYFLMKTALSKTYGMSLRVEMLSGKGYADVVGVCRLPPVEGATPQATKQQNIPFVFELKYDRAETARSALNQIENRGYLNNLILRSNADFAILLGANAIPGKISLESTIRGMPKSRDFSAELFGLMKSDVGGGASGGSTSKSPLWGVIDGVQQMYMTHHDSVYKKGTTEGGRDYTSTRMIGKLAQKVSDRTSVYVIKPGDTTGSTVGSSTGTAGKSGIPPDTTRYLLVTRDQHNPRKVDMVEVVLTERHAKNPSTSVAPTPPVKPTNLDVDINSYQRVTVDIDPYSKREAKDSFGNDHEIHKLVPESAIKNGQLEYTANPREAGGPPIVTAAKIETMNIANIENIPTNKLVQLGKVDMDAVLRKDAPGHQAAVDNMRNQFVDLADKFWMEHNAQAYVHGLFERPVQNLNNGNKKVTTVYAEANTNQAGKVDVLIKTHVETPDGHMIPDSQTQSAVAVEIGHIGNGESGKAETMLNKKVEQNKNYGRFNIATDSKTITYLTLVFDARTESTARINRRPQLYYDIQTGRIDHESANTSPVLGPIKADLDADFETISLTRRRREAVYLNESQYPTQSVLEERVSSGTSKMWRLLDVSNLGSILHWIEPVVRSTSHMFTSTLWEKGTDSGRHRNRKQESSTDFVSSCTAGAWRDGVYDENGITCHTSTSGSYLVFYTGPQPHQHTELVRRPLTNKYGLSGDTYYRRSCTPVYFNGRESIFCQGKNSSFVYTPDPSFLRGQFENLDGNLMLGATILHTVSSWWKRLTSGSHETQTGGDVTQDNQVSEDMLESLHHKRNNIDKLLTQVDNLEEQSSSEYDWVFPLLHDCDDHLTQLQTSRMSPADQLELLAEKLDAILEDLEEQLVSFDMENPGENRRSHPGGTGETWGLSTHNLLLPTTQSQTVLGCRSSASFCSATK